MFIKVCRSDREYLFNCDNYTWNHNDGDSSGVLIINGQTLTIECKPENAIYIMNDHGKTIDRKTWQ